MGIFGPNSQFLIPNSFLWISIINSAFKQAAFPIFQQIASHKALTDIGSFGKIGKAHLYLSRTLLTPQFNGSQIFLCPEIVCL
jgi:hypothetical protein